MKNILLGIIKAIQWIVAFVLLFISYGGFQGNDVLIPVILLVVAILITPPVIKLLFGRRKKTIAPGR